MTSGPNRPRESKYLLARFFRVTLAKLALLLFRVRAFDIDRIPASTGAVISGNHVSYADPVLLWCKSPRRVRFMGKSELWDSRVIGWGLTKVWAFPVRRGSADRAAIMTATNYLKAGELLGIFPEGTRNRDSEGLAQGQEGAAFIAMRAGVPIIPLGIDGTGRIMPDGARMLRFPRVTMCFGEPVDPADYSELPRKERLQVMTAVLMERITAEVDRAERS